MVTIEVEENSVGSYDTHNEPPDKPFLRHSEPFKPKEQWIRRDNKEVHRHASGERGDFFRSIPVTILSDIKRF